MYYYPDVNAKPQVRKLQVRMPPALHKALVQRAAEQGVSLNQLIVLLLAGGIGFEFTDN
jgi:predicted HicB family RNase H-like nuclease